MFWLAGPWTVMASIHHQCPQEVAECHAKALEQWILKNGKHGFYSLDWMFSGNMFKQEELFSLKEPITEVEKMHWTCWEVSNSFISAIPASRRLCNKKEHHEVELFSVIIYEWGSLLYTTSLCCMKTKTGTVFQFCRDFVAQWQVDRIVPNTRPVYLNSAKMLSDFYYGPSDCHTDTVFRLSSSNTKSSSRISYFKSYVL